MSNALERLEAILREKLPDNQVRDLIAELTIASGDNSVAISEDATGAVIITGSHNIVGDNNQIVINQGLNSEDLVKILLSFQQERSALEQIRSMIQELQELLSFQSLRPNSFSDASQDSQSAIDDVPFRKLSLDPTTLKAVNKRIEIIEEIYSAGCLSEDLKNGLRQLKQRLQAFSNLNQDLQNITQQGDHLIQETVAAMRLQLDALKLASTTLTISASASASNPECPQAEAEIFQTFVHRLEDSRLGANWITENMEMLINHANKTTLRQFPDLNGSEQAIDDFKFSLKQFLEQVSFSLYWGSYEILDSPEIPLVFGIEQYEIAFRAMKQTVPGRLPREAIRKIEACLDYLIDRLRFYE